MIWVGLSLTQMIGHAATGAFDRSAVEACGGDTHSRDDSGDVAIEGRAREAKQPLERPINYVRNYSAYIPGEAIHSLPCSPWLVFSKVFSGGLDV